MLFMVATKFCRSLLSSYIYCKIPVNISNYHLTWNFLFKEESRVIWFGQYSSFVCKVTAKQTQQLFLLKSINLNVKLTDAAALKKLDRKQYKFEITISSNQVQHHTQICLFMFWYWFDLAKAWCAILLYEIES